MAKFKVLLSCVTLLVGANAQIIFPDQFELMQQSQANAPKANAPFPTLPSNLYPNYVDNNNANRNNVYGFAAQAGIPTVTEAVSGVNFSAVSGVNDAESNYWSNHVNNLIARGVTKFTLDMDRAIHVSSGPRAPGERPNVIFSPLSLVGTLAMVLLGSAGITFQQVVKILGLESGVDISAHSEIVHQMFGLLLDSVDGKSNTLGPQATMASGIFVQTGFPIRPEFKAISQHVYNNEVINLDFIGHPNEATRSVNDWVKERTRGMISSILGQPVDPDTKLIIASALYFSGEWNQHFLTGATKRKPFAVTSSQSVMVDMMYSGGEFPFFEDKQLGVKIIGLPYKGTDPASKNGFPAKYQAMMYVMLPTAKGEDALANLENRLTPEGIESMISKMVNQTCILGLPRMKLSSSLNLNRALNSLGLSSLFDPKTSNLGLLSPGYSGENTNGQPSIFTRVGDDEDSGATEKSTTGGGDASRVKKNNYFRYEDKRGGYSVEQWDSGVIIEKIRRSRRRREAAAGAGAEGKGAEPEVAQKVKEEAEKYEIRSSDQAKVKVVPIGEDKYKFEGSKGNRDKRQSRPIDSEFIRFVKSHGSFPAFGLDTLRNSPNLPNPGLFASDVLHKVEMDVTETGTVGAAATTIVLQRSGDAKRLLANRPFLFFIRHEPSKLMLFWGTVNKPTPSY